MEQKRTTAVVALSKASPRLLTNRCFHPGTFVLLLLPAPWPRLLGRCCFPHPPQNTLVGIQGDLGFVPPRIDWAVLGLCQDLVLVQFQEHCYLNHNYIDIYPMYCQYY